jgi:hypothetical protein
MLKKSLIFGSIAVLAALLLITGCSNPTSSSGSSGNEDPETPISPPSSNPGTGGNTGKADTLYGPVAADQLAEKFASYTEVYLDSTVTFVEGVVPSGKKLTVLGNTAITAGSTLAVAGSVEIKPNMVLEASYTTTAGHLTGSGRIYGGTVSLPYIDVAHGGVLPENGIAYDNTKVESAKVIGAVIDSASAGTKLAGSQIGTLFDDLNVTELTLANIIGLVNTDVPQNKKLTLTGTNTIAVALDLSAYGNLVINGTLATPVGGSGIVITGANNITISETGTLNLANAGDTVVGVITNEGIIISSSVTNQKLLMELDGGGMVKLFGVTNPVLAEVVKLRQNVSIEDGGNLKPANTATPFASVGDTKKTITITENGTLTLAATVTTLSGVNIVNSATTGDGITTATGSTGVLNTILALGGKISSSAAITGTDPVTVPAGVKYTQAAAFVGNAASTATLTIAEDAEATFAGTFADQEAAVTINGKATFTAGTFAALVTGLTIGPNADVTFGAATFEALTQELIFRGTVNLGAAAAIAPLHNVTVSSGSNLTITGAGSLSINPGKTLTNNGTIDLGTSSGKLKLGTSDIADVAQIIGGPTSPTSTAGTIIAGPTVISGTWVATADGTTDQFVTITSGPTGAAIGVVTNATGLKAGTNGRIVQNVVASGTSALTVTTGIIDLGTAGSLELKAAADATAGSIDASGGSIIAGPTTITKVWTATGTAGAVTITPTSGATGATIATGTTAALVAGTAGAIVQATKTGGSILTITGNGLKLPASIGTVTLTSASAAADSASTSGTITAGATTITGAWKASIPEGTVAITSAASEAGAVITATTSAGLEAVDGGNGIITQRGGASNTLNVGANTTLNLIGGGLGLAADATGGGKITVTATGKIAAGPTEITGVWNATGTSGTVNITGTTTGATIERNGIAATGLLATAAGSGAITQKAGSSSASILAIGVGTTIDLAGDDSTGLGTITLTAHASYPGSISFTASSLLSTGETAGLALNPITNLQIDGKAVAVGGNFTTVDFVVNSTKELRIGGTHDGSIAAGNSANVVIDSTKVVSSS